jgi:hypothetical protein
VDWQVGIAAAKVERIVGEIHFRSFFVKKKTAI